MKNQNETILQYMKRKSITQADALALGCYRLAARINDLRNMGHDIETRMEPHPGGKHARYFLKRV